MRLNLLCFLWEESIHGAKVKRGRNALAVHHRAADQVKVLELAVVAHIAIDLIVIGMEDVRSVVVHVNTVLIVIIIDISARMRAALQHLHRISLFSELCRQHSAYNATAHNIVFHQSLPISPRTRSITLLIPVSKSIFGSKPVSRLISVKSMQEQGSLSLL